MGSGDPTPSRSWLGNRNFLARLWRAAASSDWSLLFCERGESPLSHIPPKTRAANGVRCHQFFARSARRRARKVARKHGNAGLQTRSAPRSGAKPHIATGEEARGRLGTPDLLRFCQGGRRAAGGCSVSGGKCRPGEIGMGGGFGLRGPAGREAISPGLGKRGTTAAVVRRPRRRGARFPHFPPAHFEDPFFLGGVAQAASLSRESFGS